jgi:hypothetical protein
MLVQPAPMKSTVTYEGGALRIDLPPRRSWFLAAFLIFWLALWNFGIADAVRTIAARKSLGLEAIWLIFAVCADFVAVYWWLSNLFGQESIRATPGEMTVRKSIFGLGLNRSYRVPDVKRLRFTPAMGTGRSYRESQIEFDYGARTYSFALHLDEAEANEIIRLINSTTGRNLASASEEKPGWQPFGKWSQQ